MSGRPHPRWPVLAVLAGYLVSDLFLSGIEAALFVAALGAGVFLVLLVVARTPSWSILLEGLLLGAIGYAGELTGRPGAGFAFLELAAAAVFLVSVALGRPWLQGQMRSLTGAGLDGRLAGRMTAVMGTVFLLHGAFLTVMMLTSGIRTLPAVVSFAALYLGALVLLRRRGRRESVRVLPGLVPSGDGMLELRLQDSVLGTVEVDGDRIAGVTVVSLGDGTDPGRFLGALEAALASRGARTVRIGDWPQGAEALEMAGYVMVSGSWQRVLPAFR